MTSSLVTHSFVLVSGQEKSGDAPGKSAVASVLSRLRSCRGVEGVGFDPASRSLRVRLDSARLSMGDVVRLIEESGVKVCAVERSTTSTALIGT